MATEPNATATAGRVHFIVIRPLQRVVRRHDLSGYRFRSHLVELSVELLEATSR